MLASPRAVARGRIVYDAGCAVQFGRRGPRPVVSDDGQVMTATFHPRGSSCAKHAVSFRAVRWSGGPGGAMWAGKTEQGQPIEMRIGRIRRSGKAFVSIPFATAFAACENGSYIANVHNIFGYATFPATGPFPPVRGSIPLGPFPSGHPGAGSDSQFTGDFNGTLDMRDNSPKVTGVIRMTGTRSSQPPIGQCDTGPVRVTMTPVGS